MAAAFSLLEILFVLGCIGILVVVATPLLQQTYRRHQLQQSAQQIYQAVEQARQRAISHAQRVIFCPVGTRRGQCGQHWQAGQMLIAAQTGKAIKFFPALPAGISMQWRSSLGRHATLQFTADGFTFGQQGTFVLKRVGEGQEQSRRLTVLRSGRVRFQ